MLIVDDNKQNIYMLQVLLEANGFKVQAASNGAEALDLARRQPPDMIISDILMPVMDGFALCRACKGDRRLRKIPFVFYTATYTDKNDEEFALSLGAAAFIIKPLDPDKFMAIIAQILKNHRVFKQPAPRKAVKADGFYLKYNEVLVRKLEHKMLQLEQANSILERDILERKRTEQILRESEGKYRALIENIPQKIFLKNTGLVYLSCNRHCADDLRVSPDEIAGKTDYDFFPAELADRYRADDRRVMESGQAEEIEEERSANGAKAWVRIIRTPLSDDQGRIAGVMGIYWDVTERRRAEEERRKLEAQMIQAQKIESVGRLAGSIAHDFNNMLGVIFGCVELALKEIGPEDPLRGRVAEIQSAAQSAAELTRQLLTFARRQPANPKVISLNDSVAATLKLFKRLIGENIEVIWRPGADLWPVKIDPGQVEQILANLCVNARDAISGAGRVVIESANVKLEAGAGRLPDGAAPGEYVRFSVQDSGCGIDSETLKHIFEPFFTTKGAGKGTGLGLSTVYGIVKQNGGHIAVTSEPNRGTTFEILLPRHSAGVEKSRAAAAVPAAPGQETLLLVEDEPRLVNLIRLMLESLGYKVFSAVSPGEAIRLADQHAGQVDLLMTDLVMPEMNGRDLSAEIRKRHPGMKVLFTSGYSEELLAAGGPPAKDIRFIQKPYSINDLAAKVREALDSKPA